MFSEDEIQQIESRGSEINLVEQQVANFVNGFPYLDINRAAAIEDGILKFSDEEIRHFVELYESASSQKDIIKFVPASGAASRMFKELFAFAEDGKLEGNKAAEKFISGLKDFAFYGELKERLNAKNIDIDDASNSVAVVEELLNDEGMEYGSLPKGLLKFHTYDDGSRTPVEEHFVEGAAYALGNGNEVNLHFTVSPEHQAKFEQHVDAIRPQYEQAHGVAFNVSFSQQKKSTDTIAVDLENKPFKENGKILFRPAGHGALLANLDDLNGDLIFIKNIDNVVPDKLKEPTFIYKKVIGGLLIELQDKIYEATNALSASSDVEAISNAEALLKDRVNLKFPSSYDSLNQDEKREFLLNKLDRPLRVCGIVKNTGEPGGGPFWVQNEDGSESIQIGETAQLDLNDPEKAAILKNSTHFSPTDIVCGVKDRNGNKYDLMKHRDPETGFIAIKSKSGRDLKAQELPGLWNGSMADWNSVMVEVALETFNPVKSVNDLLKPAHQ